MLVRRGTSIRGPNGSGKSSLVEHARVLETAPFIFSTLLSFELAISRSGSGISYKIIDHLSHVRQLLSAMSLGNRQAAGIVMEVWSYRESFLFDEVSNGLDKKKRRYISLLLRDISKVKKGFLDVSHGSPSKNRPSLIYLS